MEIRFLLQRHGQKDLYTSLKKKNQLLTKSYNNVFVQLEGLPQSRTFAAIAAFSSIAVTTTCRPIKLLRFNFVCTGNIQIWMAFVNV